MSSKDRRSSAAFSPAVSLTAALTLALVAGLIYLTREKDFPLLALCGFSMAGWVIARVYAFFRGIRAGARILSYHAACIAAFIVFVVLVLALGTSDPKPDSGDISKGSMIFLTAMFYGVPNFVMLMFDLIGNYINKEN